MKINHLLFILLLTFGVNHVQAQKRLKGKEIGIDARLITGNGSGNFLIRKPTPDSTVVKRYVVNLNHSSSTTIPIFEPEDAKIIPDKFKSAYNKSTSFGFGWGKEHYFPLEKLNNKKLDLYHTLQKSINLSNSTNTYISNFSNQDGTLNSVSKNQSGNYEVSLGLSYYVGLRYHFAKRFTIGLESGLGGSLGLFLGNSSYKTFRVSDLSESETNKNGQVGSSLHFNTRPLNAVWLTYHF
jgi:hypothetical protein